MNLETGVLYVCTGKDYTYEALRSATSVREHMPLVAIAIYTDSILNIDDQKGCFDIVENIPKPNYSFSDKILPLLHSPFKKTLFLDSDTILMDSVYELFELLDKFEMLYCHAPWRITPGANNQLSDVPKCFVEANTGVIAYNSTTNVKQFFKSWADIYSSQLRRQSPPSHDQPAFREALYTNSLNAYVLPAEYNLRTPFPLFKGPGLKAKILHGRGPSLERAIQELSAMNDKFVIKDYSKDSLQSK